MILLPVVEFSLTGLDGLARITKSSPICDQFMGQNLEMTADLTSVTVN